MEDQKEGLCFCNILKKDMLKIFLWAWEKIFILAYFQSFVYSQFPEDCAILL